jgi:type I restriction enzyme S subunit
MSTEGSIPSRKYQLHHWEKSYGKVPRGWQFRRLGDFFEERSEFSLDQSAYPLHSFTIENGVTPKTDRYERQFLLRDAETNEYRLVRHHDLIFNPMNIRFGAVDIYFGAAPVSVSAYYTIAAPTSQEVDLRFLKMYLKSPYMLDVYHRIAIGSLIEKRRVHWSMLKHIHISIPPLEEQKGIADLLGTWDRAIGAIDKLIQNSIEQKRSLMEQLLTAKQRLPGFGHPWKRKALKSLGPFRKGKGLSRESVVSSGVPCVLYGDIYTKYADVVRTLTSFIPGSLTQDSQLIRQGDLLFTASGETPEEIGKCVAYLGNADAYAGGDILILSPKSDDSEYLGYLLNHSGLMHGNVMR